jgi:hypothetical protein
LFVVCSVAPNDNVQSENQRAEKNGVAKEDAVEKEKQQKAQAEKELAAKLPAEKVADTLKATSGASRSAVPKSDIVSQGTLQLMLTVVPGKDESVEPPARQASAKPIPGRVARVEIPEVPATSYL